ncbi:MAG: hypothetical protein JSS82_07325 [Bacteroidetes bacterium]|nr:hypothetical protein [Bacteroidota bacterium]
MIHKYFILAVLILTGFGTGAQTIDKLDKANGFKEFKLGTTLSVLDKDLVKTKSGVYRYTGKNHTTAFGSSVHRIYLRFDSTDKLSGVYISIRGLVGKSGVNSYKNIISLNYGKEHSKENSDTSVSYRWTSEKVNMSLYGWEAGDTWDAELVFRTPEQYAADNDAEKKAARQP